MSPSTSASKPKFLLDENVRHELFVFLKSKGWDVKFVPKGSTDREVARLSKKERRVLVTNDADFTLPELYSTDDLFALIWLRLPQADKEGLLATFVLLLDKVEDFAGKVVILHRESWEVASWE